MTTLALTEVQFDQSIYPRAEWSQSTVNRYAESLTAGDEFPPIVHLVRDRFPVHQLTLGGI